ncbi:transcription factor IBH1-like [Diospyros lotus]|uniref:transcription factor IBH1-like n=1 Tax=Diospyros lotus TaxID=55363 RepID=UPI0022555BE6|nr:transcription factor IBH1-like [Diospyros lotus]
MKPTSSIRTRFAYGFLRAMKRLRNRRRPAASSSSSSSSAARAAFGRYRKLKMVADASMASAVGSRRAWSRALLWKITRRQALVRRALAGKRRRSGGDDSGIRRSVVVENEGTQDHHHNQSGVAQTDILRRLVPGGESMDLYSLLGETAHYIKCLTIQVKVMKNIVDFCST